MIRRPTKCPTKGMKIKAWYEISGARGQKKILNALREKKEVTYKRLGVKIILDFITAGS